jgi:predicted RNA-binding protein with PUA-like domain
MASSKKTATTKKVPVKSRTSGAPSKPVPKASAATKKPAKPTEVSQFFTPEGGPWGMCFVPRTPGERRYWLVKSEPGVFSWADLNRAPGRTTHWNGVRNFAARNFMRDGMRRGDLVFFYHSSADPQAIIGICEVVREAYPDPTAFDASHGGYDESSSADAPTWFMVDLRAVEALPRPVTLVELKATTSLSRMALIRTGRLSVVPVTPAEWQVIVAMGRA